MLNRLLLHALQKGASHVHIEPTETAILVRLRIAGTLRPTMMLAQSAAAGLITRIKTLARINAYEQNHPQNGDFSIQTPEAHYNFRVATIPVMYGEKIVLQITKQQH